MPAEAATDIAAPPVPSRLRLAGVRASEYVPFVLVVGAVIALAILLEGDSKIAVLKIGVVAYFSLLPAILYLQFASRKTPTVWREYVLTLFRLHADDYANLPQPPETSRYYGRWQKERTSVVGTCVGEEHLDREAQNVYRRRFEELYGPLREEGSGDRRNQSIRLERAHKLQVLVATLLMALGWVFVVQPESIFGKAFTGDIDLQGLPSIPTESFAFVSKL